ncbi:MAG: helix-turn-helix domain-containing protein [Pseudonocardiales bacterium]
MNESHDHVAHPLLRSLVPTMTGYRQEGLPAGLHRGVPSPHLTLVITIDGPLRLAAHADPRQPPGTYDGLVGGLHTRPALIAHKGRQFGVQLAITPLGARALLGMPAGELASWDADLTDVLGLQAPELVERVRAARDWPGRFAAIELAFLRLARSGVAVAPEVAEAWRLTTGSYGRLRVAEVARRVGWSSRHLGERFRVETGLTPKEAGRVARFHHARGLLLRRVGTGRPADLAALASVCGYADQAHLTRDWNALTGLPPARYLAAEFGFVQDREPAAMAQSPA